MLSNIFFLMLRLPPRSTLTYTHFPYNTLFRSAAGFNMAENLFKLRRTECDAMEGGQKWSSRTKRKPSNRKSKSHSAIHCSPLALPKGRSEEHTSELQSLMRISYAVLCSKKKRENTHIDKNTRHIRHETNV